MLVLVAAVGPRAAPLHAQLPRAELVRLERARVLSAARRDL